MDPVHGANGKESLDAQAEPVDHYGKHTHADRKGAFFGLLSSFVPRLSQTYHGGSGHRRMDGVIDQQLTRNAH